MPYVDCDDYTTLIHGDRIPGKGVALRGQLVYEDGQLLGCTVTAPPGRPWSTEHILERGPTGPIDYYRLYYEPLQVG